MYAASAKDEAIERKQDNKSVKCNDPKFNDYICMSYKDFEDFYKTYVLGCKEWAPVDVTTTHEEAMKEYGKVRTDQ